MVKPLSRKCLDIMVFFLAAISQAPSAHSQIFYDASSDALGRSGRASVGTMISPLLNPATLPYLADSAIGTVFKENKAKLGDPTVSHAVIVTDNSRESLVSGGFTYLINRKSSPEKTVMDEDIQLALGTKIKPHLAFGVSAHRLVRRDSLGPEFTKYNYGLGVLVIPKPYLGLSFNAYDMLNDDDQDFVPVLAVGSQVLILDFFRILMDFTRLEKKNPGEDINLHLGIEIKSDYGLMFRVGGMWDQVQKQRFYSVGLGLEGPRLNLGYSYRRNIDQGADSTHTLNVWVQM